MTTKLFRIACFCIIVQPFVPAGWGQGRPAQVSPTETTASPAKKLSKKTPSVGPYRHLHTELTRVPSEIAEDFEIPLHCDADGNLYVRTDPSGVGAIRRMNSKGDRVALLQPSSANVKAAHPLSFAIGPDGYVYQLIDADEIQYVFVYSKDGSIKSEIKLQPGFPFFPNKLAVFPNGDLLIAGLEYDKNRRAAMWPFTGIFSSDGSLRKELTLKDDREIHDRAAAGDPKVTPPEYPTANNAVSFGIADTAADGNVYLMRKLSPAILYAISPGGSVRRFKVDPGDANLVPQGMQIAGSRIAILFWQPQTHEEILKVVDLQGHDIASYRQSAPKEGDQQLGLAFVCYSQNPERFTFLEAAEDNKLELLTASPD